MDKVVGMYNEADTQYKGVSASTSRLGIVNLFDLRRKLINKE